MFELVMTGAASILAVLILGFVLCFHTQDILNGDSEEKFVAEVWLEWEICTGSTMFRAAFSSAKRAERAARLAAKLLDLVLPRAYPAEYSSGRRYYETYNFEIRWGVRAPTGMESERGVSRIWTTVMPGSSSHQGEHASAHPTIVDGDIELSGSTAGYKV